MWGTLFTSISRDSALWSMHLFVTNSIFPIFFSLPWIRFIRVCCFRLAHWLRSSNVQKGTESETVLNILLSFQFSLGFCHKNNVAMTARPPQACCRSYHDWVSEMKGSWLIIIACQPIPSTLAGLRCNVDTSSITWFYRADAKNPLIFLPFLWFFYYPFDFPLGCLTISLILAFFDLYPRLVSIALLFSVLMLCVFSTAQLVLFRFLYTYIKSHIPGILHRHTSEPSSTPALAQTHINIQLLSFFHYSKAQL